MPVYRFAPALCLTIPLMTTALPAFAGPSDEQFKAIYTTEWAWRQSLQQTDENNVNAGVAAHLPDVSAAAQSRQLVYWQDVESKLAAIDTKSLSAENQVNYQVYKTQIDGLVAAKQFREYEKPVNSDSSFWADLTYITESDFHTEADYRNYIGQLSDMPRYFDQQIVNMKAGLERHFTAPQVTLEGRDASIRTVIDIKKPEDSVYYKPFLTMPASIPAAKQAELRALAVKAINEAVIPAHKTLLAFFDTDYVPHAQMALGASELPDGAAYYQSKIREFTTLDLPPAQIHQLGLDQMALIRAQMLEVMKEVKFEGDLPAFLAYLRSDPKFYAKTPQDLLDRAAWIAKTFDGKASQYFGRLPRSRFAIVPVAPEIAPYYTSGRGGPGAYYVNTYDLPSRPLFQLTALTLHESAPGHAFQMPLALENKSLPEFRQKTYISAYGEGWALYSEYLGVEMGMYDTPYDRFGYLSYQAWRASRLVVDTGIHAMGWTREQARLYLRDNTALSEHEIDTEVDRYISWPGQALSYYLGEMAIRDARTKAEKALGDKFNIRAFHDAVLELGSVPLPVLTAHIDAFIAGGGVGPYPDEEK
ncbi:DUF885 domain-containing protein [Asticcacaulis taihuensis]|uniref:Uncharacterized conserved protein, DUF885 familyt n=1 Tax=Asticcacaulis taihuensis TaxID=260084 RepID=A0A1G4SHY0_9CAUL|nr:DUF885 family protein [Asticcacaulis taihuensis]SCW67919.1 Uncharacterized conserved protein, DUF885 familyt [Asticcacaulis taihuensis]